MPILQTQRLELRYLIDADRVLPITEVTAPTVVLKLKFTRRIPEWWRQQVTRLELAQAPTS